MRVITAVTFLAVAVVGLICTTADESAMVLGNGTAVTPVLLGAEGSRAFEPAAPWTAPVGSTFRYQGLENSLAKLLRVQASLDRWITIITMSGKIQRFVLNCVYSLHKYGHWSHYILVTFDDESLVICKQLNLPCYNGTKYASAPIRNGDHNFGSATATEIWWAKQRMAKHLIHLGFNVHGSDADVVYLRDLRAGYDAVFQKTRADGIFATEEWIYDKGQGKANINYINAGVYAVKSNLRSLNFFRRWTAHTAHGQGGIDQEKLNSLFLHAYMFCDSKVTCAAVQKVPKFAIFRHKSFFPDGFCIEDTLRPAPCDTRRLYIHHLCGYGWESKTNRWNNLKVWLIDEDLKPMFSDGGGPHGPHPFMPCEQQAAWPEIESMALSHETELFAGT